MSDDPIADRRQRAREAFHDGESDLDWAVEVAMQVKITDDIVSDAMTAVSRAQAFTVEEIQAMTTAAFRAAGFEVVE